jgi:hypothetical protein
MVEQVKSSITKAFKHFNTKDGIEMNNIRVKIVKSNGELHYTLMNKTENVRTTTLTEMVGAMHSLLAKNQLHSSVERLIKESGLNESEANVRLYPLPDNSPSAYLYENGKPLKPIEIEKLIN